MKPNTKIVLGAIAAIGVLELYALSQGIDGKILTMSIAMISGLAGWVAPQPKALMTK